jgi:hypothetical protein
VRRRGQLMQAASDARFGAQGGGFAMTALMPLSRADAEAACAAACLELPGAECQVANVNSPQQIVLSGALDAVERAVAIAKQRFGARRAMPLKVSAPFHSQAMRGTESAFAEELAAVRAQGVPPGPALPYVRNSDARVLARWAGSHDLSSAVLWLESVHAACAVLQQPRRQQPPPPQQQQQQEQQHPPLRFLECGGTVLAPLVRACLPPSSAACEATSLLTADHVRRFLDASTH